MPEYERFLAGSRAEWREWLERNHARTAGIWLVTYKKESGHPHLAYDESVEEALCFGWVDSRPNALDAERSMRLMTPRKRGSPWSRLNKERVARLTAEGRMAEAGLRKVEEAKRDGSWTEYDDIEDLVVPPDLRAALDADPEALAHFERFPESSKKTILWWIKSARQPATRTKRIAETVSMAARNLRANHYRQ